MPDESEANLRYGTFCIFCCYDIQKQHILNTLNKQKLINPLLINRHSILKAFFDEKYASDLNSSSKLSILSRFRIKI